MRYNRAMSQVLTISCKLKVSESQAVKLDATLEIFMQALNWVNQNTPQKIVNAVKLQSHCHYEVRTRFHLSSNLAQQVCWRVAGARKAAKQKNRPMKAFKWGLVTTLPVCEPRSSTKPVRAHAVLDGVRASGTESFAVNCCNGCLVVSVGSNVG